MATKAAALAYRETVLAGIDAKLAGKVGSEWTRSERDAYYGAQREQVRREMAALRALPDDASAETVRAAVAS
jgi:hypothetical protein